VQVVVYKVSAGEIYEEFKMSCAELTDIIVDMENFFTMQNFSRKIKKILHISPI